MKAEIEAPVSGTIIEVCVQVGDRVKELQNLFVIELGKTLITVRSTATGLVTSVMAAAGDQIERDAKIVTID